MFFAHFSVAVVTAVSCWPASVAAEVSLVSQSARGRVLCAKEFALLGLMVGVSAKKLSLRAQKGPQSAFYGVLGDFFATMPLEGLRWANVVAPLALLACHATIRGPGQACRQPTTARPKQTARDRRKRTARPRIMRGRAAIRRIKQQHATQSLQTALRP